MPKKRVVVALSGGVDSSMAALTLQETGHEVIGVTMRLWATNEATSSSKSQFPNPARNIIDAEQTCHKLDIPFHILHLEREFKEHVIQYLIREYTQGRTPNPCISCNQYIKFGFLLEHALALDADYLATGHYVRVEHHDNAYHLLKGVDPDKDQSYMLYTLTQKKLARTLFPLGNYSKRQVRDLAREKGLPAAGKPSSQDICFVAADYGTFLSQHVTTEPGDIVDGQGKVLGKHRGAAFYTIGQRHGLGLSTARPLYVTRIEPSTNRVVVGDESQLGSSSLIAVNLNWASGKSPSQPLSVNVKIRYRSPEAPATIHPQADSVNVVFDQPQRAIAPGQAVVFYQGNEVIGGGTIQIAQKSHQS
ncbi:MAG: tRNA 2-thiouridine(34) synthase MnmA [Chloroflexi bacterium]|nr:tRNA 2-thiouridine(34) synthase MnmA [Chloroflexota bacterium]MBM3182675.1 tRNA 2-thiouridine(34) synthase MnmA [Chloroflexota bacterium]